ncbi:hypothetical protein [Burkholderia ubonensis]|uniref:hypothetical protein n=1 Tax=Burkholderia ubonensis TaxID=101571 RepID=UPI0018E1D33E|nr:hypothetical protein [Burkholderia ubonensis]
MEFKDIGERLDNWSRVVRDPGTRPQFCASWARTAVALRNVGLRSDSDDVPQNDIPDGWIVEQAWQSIRDPLAKRLLQHHYIFRMSPELVCRILVRKYSAAPGVLNHWDVRLAKSHAIMLKVLADMARAENFEETLKIFEIPVVNIGKVFYATA